jgi:branched-chain amino acid transport system permease protein
MAGSLHKRLLTRENALILLCLALLVLPVLAHAFEQQYLITQFRRFLILAIAAVSLDLILGYGGMVCFGHAAFVGIGAYTVGLLQWANAPPADPGLVGLASGPLASWLTAVVVASAAALVIGAVSLRTSGVYFIMITLAFAQLVYFLFVGLKDIGGDEGLPFKGDRMLGGAIDLRQGTVFYYIVLSFLGLILWGLHRLVRSRFGLVIQGCRENEARMRALGVETYRYKLTCFVIAGALAGFSGALFATHESFVSPSIMHWTRSGDLIVMVLLGGIGTLVGPVFGAIGFLLLESFLPDYSEHWMLLFGPAVIVIVLYAKQGLYGSLPGARPRLDKGTRSHA